MKRFIWKYFLDFWVVAYFPLIYLVWNWKHRNDTPEQKEKALLTMVPFFLAITKSIGIDEEAQEEK